MQGKLHFDQLSELLTMWVGESESEANVRNVPDKTRLQRHVLP